MLSHPLMLLCWPHCCQPQCGFSEQWKLKANHYLVCCWWYCCRCLGNQRRKKAIYDMVSVQQWNVLMVWVSSPQFCERWDSFSWRTRKSTYIEDSVSSGKSKFFQQKQLPASVGDGNVSTQKNRGNNLVLSHWHRRCCRRAAFYFLLFVLLFFHPTFYVHRLIPIFHVIHRMFGFGFFFLGRLCFFWLFSFLIWEHVLFFRVCECVRVEKRKSYSTETLYTCLSIKP